MGLSRVREVVGTTLPLDAKQAGLNAVQIMSKCVKPVDMGYSGQVVIGGTTMGIWENYTPLAMYMLQKTCSRTRPI